jgi:hypothetical protein
MSLATATETSFLLDAETILEHKAPEVAHYIDRGSDKRSAGAIVTEALIHGTPLKALCGESFIPSRDPKKFPICQKCVQMLSVAKGFYGIGE